MGRPGWGVRGRLGLSARELGRTGGKGAQAGPREGGRGGKNWPMKGDGSSIYEFDSRALREILKGKKK